MNWPARAGVWVQGPFSLTSSSSSKSDTVLSYSVTPKVGHGSGIFGIVPLGCKGLILVCESGGFVGWLPGKGIFGSGCIDT